MTLGQQIQEILMDTIIVGHDVDMFLRPNQLETGRVYIQHKWVDHS